MINFRIANEQDRDSIIDFINMVFSMLRVPHNFEAMLPKAYSKELGRADIHVIAEEDGRLCGCLGMHVFPMKVGDELLRVGYLGSMSVHPRVRGKGTMGELMRRQLQRGEEMELDMIVLGGQRQRYQYSGFETVGTAYVYNISRSNVRHAFSDVDSEGIAFRSMDNGDIEYCLDLYNRQPVCGARTKENFIAVLNSYRNCAWAIEHCGKLIGYLCAAGDNKHICELVTSDEDAVSAVVKAWITKHELINLRITAAPHDTSLNTLLSRICEGFSITPICMMRILNHQKVLSAYMKLKHQIEPLCFGKAVIEWEGAGCFALSVGEEGIAVRPAEEQICAENRFTNTQALQLFFGCNRFAAPAARHEMPGNWFPLPFYIGEPDSF